MIQHIIQYVVLPLAASILMPGVLFCNGVGGYSTNNENRWDVLWGDVVIGLEDAAGFYTAPFAWDGESVVHASVFSGATLLAFAADGGLRKEMLTVQHSSLNRVFYTTELLGQLRGWQYACGAMYATGWLAGDDEVRVTGRLMIESIIIGGVTAIVVQTGLGRSRPFVEKGAFDFNPFTTQEKHLAFPSGHAVVAFGMASVLAERVDEPVFDVAVYSLATISVIGRVYQDKHWLSDIVVGSAIGLATGLYVSHRQEQREQNSQTLKRERFSWNISPTLQGLQFTMNL